MEDYTFKFKGKTYKLTDKWEETCINDSKAFQMQQFTYLNEVRDYLTMENRINNQIMLGYVEEIPYII